MSLEHWFRLSSYVTLGLSCGLLVSAETTFLPSLRMCLAPVLALLLLAWWVEGRWSLPVWGVNALAGIIAIGVLAWLVRQHSTPDSWVNQVPIYLALMPYMGPLLMAALVVKAFQQGGSGDFWRLQGLGLSQVSLGCVLAAGLEFGGLLAAYLASALVTLALRYRQAIVTAPDSRQANTARWLVPFAFRWTPLVAVLTLVLFLLTPRRDGSAWEPLTSSLLRPNRLRTAQAEQSTEINLNNVGVLELDDEEALQVTATDSPDQPKLDLPGDQRWRSVVLDWYEEGRWTTTRWRPTTLRPRLGEQPLPVFATGQYYLTFAVQPARAGGLVLGEPIRFGPPNARLPVEPLSGMNRSALFSELSATLRVRRFFPKQEYRYRQVVPAQADPSRTPADGALPDEYLELLTQQSVSGLQEWTLDLLRRLSTQPRYPLPDSVRAALTKPQRSFSIAPKDRETVARILADYLANSGEFTYTLERTRQDVNLDPVMDFLVNLKQGHCERYASALALMLRAVGVPARVVKGFCGADHQGEGRYVVRHRHAHAWVEMLVPRQDQPQPAFDWLMLDPTPARPASQSAFSLSQWWQKTQRRIGQLWNTLILNYNADEQAGLWSRLKKSGHLSTLLKLGLLLLAVPLALIAYVLLRRLLRRRRATAVRPTDTLAFYMRLLALLARYASLRPRVGQTPHEFGETARQFFRSRPVLISLADLPTRVIERFYRVRFGERPLTEFENQSLDAEMNQLAEALRSDK